MRATITSLFILASAIPTIGQTLPYGTQQRLEACLQAYPPQTPELAQCWQGPKQSRPVIYQAPSEACSQGIEMLDNEFLDPGKKRVLYAAMRKHGCF